MEMEIEINNNEISSSKSDEKIHKNRNTVPSKLKLNTLNMECFLNILDHLDCQTLMNLSHVNDQFRANVYAYEHIFKSKLFELEEFVDVSFIFSNQSINFFHLKRIEVSKSLTSLQQQQQQQSSNYSFPPPK